MAFEDDAAFHQVLSNTAGHLHSVKSEVPQFRIEETAHQAAALHLVKKRLQSPESKHFHSLIKSIIALAVRANIDCDFGTWRIHMAAIQKLTQSKDSQILEELPSNVRHLLFWIDLTGALQEDVYPHFSLPKSLSLSCMINSEDWHDHSIDHLPAFHTDTTLLETGETLMKTLGRLRCLNAHINSQHDQETLGGVWSKDLGLVVMRILHELLWLKPDSAEFCNDSAIHRELIRLGAILILAPFRRLLLGFHVKSESVTPKVHDLLLSSTRSTIHPVSAQVRLWVAMTAMLETTEESHKALLVREIRAAAGVLQVQNWDDAELWLSRGFMWCRSFHSQPAKAMWTTFW